MWLVATSTTPPGNLPFRLAAGEFVVGRTTRSAIVLGDATVSRRHARLIIGRCETNGCQLEDLGSANGTFVNERPVARCMLQMGDHVRFGAVACGVSSSPLFFRSLGESDTTRQIPKRQTETQLDGLTAAQLEIAAHIVEGRSEAEIAGLLGKSPHTIHTHLKTIFRRLEVHSRPELIVKLMKCR
jgi:DNA-binding CsgD family transcriptional regulator